MSPLKIAHSRLNEVRGSDLVAKGYRLLTQAPDAGVDIFSKQLRSHFVFFQGHPEYDALSLQREYLRDITRYLAGERDNYPAIPAGYFDIWTEKKLAGFQQRAHPAGHLGLAEVAEHVTHHQVLVAGMAGAEPGAAEVLADVGGDRAHAIVARRAAAGLHPEPARREEARVVTREAPAIAMPRAPAADAAHRPAGEAAHHTPDVHIHIGRVELTALTPPAPPRREPAAKRVSLDDYLRRSNRTSS